MVAWLLDEPTCARSGSCCSRARWLENDKTNAKFQSKPSRILQPAHSACGWCRWKLCLCGRPAWLLYAGTNARSESREAHSLLEALFHPSRESWYMQEKRLGNYSSAPARCLAVSTGWPRGCLYSKRSCIAIIHWCFRMVTRQGLAAHGQSKRGWCHWL